MIKKFKCNVCETIHTTEGQQPIKCSCGSKHIEPYYLSKAELFAMIKNKKFKQEEESPFHKAFLKEEIEEEDQVKKILLDVYEDIRYIIEKYLEIDPKHTKVIALWIMGTYFHKDFNSYPYLYLNAMRGSGKTRLLNLISAMSWEGTIQNSLTDAVLFRTQGTLCIDEAEGFGRKGKETLIELLNSGYKKGVVVNRMKKKKTPEGEEQVVESYSVYRPISIANITGIDNVLGDRCIKVILEKSISEKKTRLVENLLESKILAIKEILSSISKIQCSLCMNVTPQNVYIEWNKYVLEEVSTPIYITTLPTLTTLTTLEKNFDLIKNTSINGRDLELSLPLLIVSMWIEGGNGLEGLFEEILGILNEVSLKKREEESIENLDISLYDYISQEPEESYFIPLQKITDGFKQFIQTNDDWINNRWISRALTRLKMIVEKRRLSRGVEVRLNYQKAKDQMKMFK